MAKMPNIPNMSSITNFKPPPTGECRRVALWIFWTLNMLLNLIYMCLSFATSSRLVQSYEQLHKTMLHNRAWRAPVASAVLGGLMVLFFNIVSCVVLIRKSINKSGPGFGYGFIMALAFVMSFFTFLCGLVLSAFSDMSSALEDETKWKSAWTAAFYATIVFAFLCSAMYMIFFLCLVIFQGGISKTIGLYDVHTDEKRKLELAAMGRMPVGNPLSAGQTI